MGVLYWLNPMNWFRRSTPSERTPATTSDPTPAQPVANVASTPGPAAPVASTAPTTAREAAHEAGCQATTAAGTPCSANARPGSKYCGRHKGYRASAGAKQGVGSKAASTPKRQTKKSDGGKKAASSAKASRTGKGAQNGASRSNGQVRHGEYRLYQKGNRYFFSKKSLTEARAEGAVPVKSMPAGRTVVKTPNGLPVLKKA